MRCFRPCSLPARKNPGSDLSERPVCTREGHFRGGAPAPPVFGALAPVVPPGSLTHCGAMP